MFDIILIKNGEDTGRIVQYTYTREQAQQLIDKVLYKLNSDYHYKIVEQTK